MTEHNETINLGDIFYDMYGYDATLVDFFQVVRVVSPKTIEVRKIKRNYIADDKVTPFHNAFSDDEIIRMRINKWGRFKYSKWDNKPMYISPWGSY